MCVCVYMFTEQVKELKQEVIRQEDQLREVRKNSTNLEKKLEYERWTQTLVDPHPEKGVLCSMPFHSYIRDWLKR